jgi:hypothetical protein
VTLVRSLDKAAVFVRSLVKTVGTLMPLFLAQVSGRTLYTAWLMLCWEVARRKGVQYIFAADLVGKAIISGGAVGYYGVVLLVNGH